MKRQSPDSFRLPNELRDRLKRSAESRQTSKNQIMIAAIEAYLDRIEGKNAIGEESDA